MRVLVVASVVMLAVVTFAWWSVGVAAGPASTSVRTDTHTIESTPESRRAYRELFFTTPGIAAFISGVIMQDETMRQRSSNGVPLPDVLAKQGIRPGI